MNTTTINAHGDWVQRQRYKVSRRRAVVVGLGGIGSWLTQGLAPMLAFDSITPWALELYDGDHYEDRNRGRQAFDAYGDKAIVQADWVRLRFPQVDCSGHRLYLAAESGMPVRDVPVVAASQVLQEGDVVLSAVDNHATRLVISQACQRLKDVTLISGGNDLYDGNVQLYVRRRERDVTPPIEAYHPEIATPTDRAPQAMSCEELSRSEPQLLATNLMAASIMLNVFYHVCGGGSQTHHHQEAEVYFDIQKNAVVPKARAAEVRT